MKRRDMVVMGVATATTGMAAKALAQLPRAEQPPASTAAQATPAVTGSGAASGIDRHFTAAQLDQMLAPIALYPDALMAQILMAATYPLEVVEAARWSRDNQALKGDAALAAVKDKGWDVSVTSLVAFPQVLQMMSSKIDWVQNVGDAMIAQQSEVAASIQRLRAQAKAAGTLKTTPQQTVVEQPPTAGAPPDTPPAIVIQLTNPDVIYIPSYDPSTAYGPWPHAEYPPTYFPPSPGWGYGAGSAVVGGLAFGVGMAVGGAFFGGWGWGGGWGGGWGWRGWDAWGGRHSWTTVNVDRSTRIVNNFDRDRYRDGRWAHDPAHRRGAPYRTAADRERYGQNHPGAAGRAGFRGRHDGEGRGEGRGAGRGEGRGEHHGGGDHGALHGVNHGAHTRRAPGRGHASAHHAATHHGGGIMGVGITAADMEAGDERTVPTT